MKTGFTMIELVFVIVILGILAAIAIPKLAATRDDAVMTSVASEYKRALSDLAAASYAQGYIAADLANMVVLSPMIKKAGNDISVVAKEDIECARMVRNNDTNVTVEQGAQFGNTLCQLIAEEIPANYDMQILGRRVSR